MSDLKRLLSYARPYWLPLLASVFLMALAGIAHAMMAINAVKAVDTGRAA